MFNPWRAASVAAVCELGLVAWCAAYGSAPIDTASPPTFSRLALITADVGPARPSRAPQPPAKVNATIGSVTVGLDIAKAAEDLVTGTATTAIADEPKSLADKPLAEEQKPVTEAPKEEPKPVVVAALTEPSEELPAEAPAVSVVAPDTPYPLPPDSVFKDPANDPVNSAAILDECPDVDLCVNRFLFALYERTRKEDSVREDERRQVTVKRKGKMVSVTRTVSHIVDEDFAWKDAKAAEKAGMPMIDYVIGGMDRNFKLRLFYMLQAAEQAGMQPGITSAFRDDYRQSIASGLHAASDRSYHGGSSHGGYGHGLAADVVSTRGATRAERQVSSENFWRWIDIHKEFGMGRPYLDRDPPHVGALDGEEYVKHRGAVRTASGAKDRKGASDAAASKRAKTASSS
jgi:hypothetical protein